jgi:hypothetical protein
MKKMYVSFKSRTLAAGVAVALTVAGCQDAGLDTTPSTPAGTPENNLRANAESEYVEGEVLVQFSENASEAAKVKALEKVKGQPIEKILTKAMERAGKKQGVQLIKVGKKVAEAIAELNGAEGVDFAEPNFVYYHTATSADPNFTNGSLWGMYGAGKCTEQVLRPRTLLEAMPPPHGPPVKPAPNQFTSGLSTRVFSLRTPIWRARYGSIPWIRRTVWTTTATG